MQTTLGAHLFVFNQGGQRTNDTRRIHEGEPPLSSRRWFGRLLRDIRSG